VFGQRTIASGKVLLLDFLTLHSRFSTSSVQELIYMLFLISVTQGRLAIILSQMSLKSSLMNQQLDV